MAGHSFLNRERAMALSEAIETIERLLESLGEESPSERLMCAQRDVVGRNLPEFVFAMVVSELTRVVADQERRIATLEASVQKPKPKAPTKK